MLDKGGCVFSIPKERCLAPPIPSLMLASGDTTSLRRRGHLSSWRGAHRAGHEAKDE